MKVRTDNRPLYVQAEEALRELLRSQYHPGERLPAEPELAAQLGISRSTLREAIRSFEERGLISRRQGVGTFVNACPDNSIMESGLEFLESVESLARRQGLNVSDRDQRIEEIQASSEVAEKLGVPAGAPVLRIERTKIAQGTAVAYMVDVLPQAILSIDELRQGFKGSVLDLLIERGDPPLSYASAKIIPLNAGRSLSNKLGILPSSPLLLIEETLYATTNEPVGYARNYFVPGFFGFHVNRRIRG